MDYRGAGALTLERVGANFPGTEGNVRIAPARGVFVNPHLDNQLIIA